jgi:hypothetical protein
MQQGVLYRVTRLPGLDRVVVALTLNLYNFSLAYLQKSTRGVAYDDEVEVTREPGLERVVVERPSACSCDS